MSSNGPLLRFTPFAPCIDPGFWHRLSQIKLEIDKLKEDQHKIWGYYSNKKQEGLNQIFSIDASSFNQSPDGNRLYGYGQVINKNTIERFKETDKLDILKTEGEAFMKVLRESAMERPALLNKFTVLTFADLKQYNFYYKFLFLAPTFLSYNLVGKNKYLKEVFSDNEILSIMNNYDKLNCDNKGFFLIKFTGSNPVLMNLKDGLKRIDNSDDWIFAFSDSCELESPGWPLRNYLAFISYHCKKIINSPLKVLCLRMHLKDNNWHAGNSIILNVKVNIKESAWEEFNIAEAWTGWERNEKGQIATKMANLRTFLDPLKLAESSVDLNLKLMKWQLLPNLNLDIVKNTKCLLLGAGTLGCAVARNLLSWGVNKITFVDYGNVSYSNPVRQSLFKFKDAGKPKSETAAAALKEIYPNVDAKGVTFCIPMPGHSVGSTLSAETEKNIQLLEDLISEHDVVFLLMDSRESRWLPTMISAAKCKLVINSALGFDSFLVMRHGQKCNSVAEETNGKLMGSKLGCYFCNDVTAPGNSSKSRTLDQQCTVTRPGISNIAAGLAVELLISVLQHPMKGLAPAESDPELKAEGLLGIVPHSIRGFISHYHFVLPATEAFPSCVACSSKVINEYRLKNNEFILRVIESKEYLEELCGLQELLQLSMLAEVVEYSDFEDDTQSLESTPD